MPVTQPRLLLRRLHTVAAGSGGTSIKIDRIIRIIRQNMQADTCSVFLVQPHGMMTLVAAEGISDKARVSQSFIERQGLVGYVFKWGLPLNLDEAPNHPRYTPLPEQDAYTAFLGVPILHIGKVLGVLSITCAAPRRFRPEDVEALQTISMLLAEMVAKGEIIDIEEAFIEHSNADVQQASNKEVGFFGRPSNKVDQCLSAVEDILERHIPEEEWQPNSNTLPLGISRKNYDLLESVTRTARQFQQDTNSQKRIMTALEWIHDLLRKVRPISKKVGAITAECAHIISDMTASRLAVRSCVKLIASVLREFTAEEEKSESQDQEK